MRPERTSSTAIPAAVAYASRPLSGDHVSELPAACATDRFVPVPYWYDWPECQVLYREAHRMIEGSDPPEDPRLRVVRGRAFAALGRGDQAKAEFARALRLAPDDAKIREAVRIRP